MQETFCGRRRIVTLRTVWQDYRQTRRLKPRTQSNYESRIVKHLATWLDIPITDITKDMVETRHRMLSELNGQYIANSVMRTLRALITYASYKYEDAAGRPFIQVNPVKRLSEVRAWNREKRRNRVITPQQLRSWFRAVHSLNNATIRDFLLVLLFTGLRSSEAAGLRWKNVDLQSGLILLENTKNGDDFKLPLSDYAWRLLRIRQLGALNELVFPGRSKCTPISTGYKNYQAVIQQTGISFSLHDLRRTFMTIGDELDIKNEVIKALVNHRSGDVTEGYIIRSTERLRRATQRICDAILTHVGLCRQ